MNKVENIRDEFGYIILNDDNTETLNNYIQGRKTKNWINYNDKKYLFKIAESHYESYAEVIASEIGEQMGLPMAKYDFAIKNGVRGVISENFLQENDIILTGDSILEFANKILEMNDYGTKLDNSIVDIRVALKVCGISDKCLENVSIDLIKQWIFDGIIFESDRNSTNWAIIQNLGNTKLAPIFDCSTMCRMNNDINSLLNYLRSETDIANLTDNIKYKLKYQNDDIDDSFLTNFSNFCTNNKDMIPMIMEMLSKIDIEKAITNITTRMQKEIIDNKELNWPLACTLWTEKLIKFRVRDLMGICKTAINNKTK